MIKFTFGLAFILAAATTFGAIINGMMVPAIASVTLLALSGLMFDKA